MSDGRAAVRIALCCMRAALLVMLVGCALAPPEPLAPPKRKRMPPDWKPSPIRPADLAPPPRVPLSSLAPETDRRRPWPLDAVPRREPHLDVAWSKQRATLADVVAYEVAWDRIAAGDVELIEALARLARTSALPEVATAARHDVIALVADRESTATAAAARLAKVGLDTPRDLDRLAATFGAHGHDAIALELGVRATHADPTDVMGVCERTLSWRVLPIGPTSLEFDSALHCSRRAAAARCAIERANKPTDAGLGSRLIAVRECYVEFPDAEVDARAWLAILYYLWNGSVEIEDWLGIARAAEATLSLDGGEAVAVTALENAELTSPADPRIAPIATLLAQSRHHDPAFTARLVALGYAPPP